MNFDRLILRNSKVFRQLAHEFKWQFLIAVIWALYQTYRQSEGKITIFVGNFSAAFFFSSWIFSQFLRVQKQQKIESEFGLVKGGLEELDKKLQQHAEDITGFATGKKSYAYFMPVLKYLDSQEISVHIANLSKYPVYDVKGYYVDLIEIENSKGHGIDVPRQYFRIGDVFPVQVIHDIFTLPMQEKDQVNVEIKFSTRSGQGAQEIYSVKKDGKIYIAFKFLANNKWLYNIPKDFPGHDPDKPEAIFYHSRRLSKQGPESNNS